MMWQKMAKERSIVSPFCKKVEAQRDCYQPKPVPALLLYLARRRKEY